MTRRDSALVRSMPALFVLIWSTGFVVARFGMPHAPPMTFLAWRYALSIAAFGIWIALSGAAWPRGRSQWLHLVVVGLLVHAGYLGGVWSAVRAGMGAGLIALIVGPAADLHGAVDERFFPGTDCCRHCLGSCVCCECIGRVAHHRPAAMAGFGARAVRAWCWWSGASWVPGRPTPPTSASRSSRWPASPPARCTRSAGSGPATCARPTPCSWRPRCW